MKPAMKCPRRQRFSVGARVRVRQGTIDPDFASLPLGGWAGAVVEVADAGPAPYLVRWNRATLDTAHPIYCQLCAEDDRSFEEMWLDATDLVPDAGGPLAIESPLRRRGDAGVPAGRGVSPGRAPRSRQRFADATR
jgi:hypothetical protein